MDDYWWDPTEQARQDALVNERLREDELNASRSVENHHIATDKNYNAGWTPELRQIFERAGMDLNDPSNLVPLPGHSGPHGDAYHMWIMIELLAATDGLTGADCRSALQQRLGEIRQDLLDNPAMVHNWWWNSG